MNKNVSEQITFPRDLVMAIEYAYKPSRLDFHSFNDQPEGKEYSALSFQLNHHRILFRVAKVTPTKTGQFVTLWKRHKNGPILPYDLSDPYDFYVISVHKDNHFGQFVFPKAVLFEKGVLSKDHQGGKRALRVYTPWDTTESMQASKTQEWQIKYFFEIDPQRIDVERIKELFSYGSNKRISFRKE